MSSRSPMKVSGHRLLTADECLARNLGDGEGPRGLRPTPGRTVDFFRSGGMKLLSRVFLGVAALGLVGGLVLGAIPIRVYPADPASTAEREKVNCGTAFSHIKGSDDACEGPQLSQAGVILLAYLLCIVFFVLGAGTLVLNMRRELRYGGG